MKEEKRLKKIVERLKREYPDAKTALNYHNPLELLIATILSARCTDKRVNKVTSRLFEKYTSPAEFAQADTEELREDVRSTGFYKSKSKYIQDSCRIILDKYGGEVPDTMEELTELPGVARKTANVVLGNAFDKNEGIAVDTHVKRVSVRLELTGHSNPDKIEKDLMELLPKKDWTVFSHLLISHGRKICRSRNPLCSECLIADLCPSSQIE